MPLRMSENVWLVRYDHQDVSQTEGHRLLLKPALSISELARTLLYFYASATLSTSAFSVEHKVLITGDRVPATRALCLPAPRNREELFNVIRSIYAKGHMIKAPIGNQYLNVVILK
jgi:hypothetical protein